MITRKRAKELGINITDADAMQMIIRKRAKEFDLNFQGSKSNLKLKKIEQTKGQATAKHEDRVGDQERDTDQEEDHFIKEMLQRSNITDLEIGVLRALYGIAME